MTPLVIEGENLGEIHHKYNKLVNDAIKNKNVELTEINYDDSDLDNLFKIDIACKNHNVEYILKVLQCTDILYVSRAIKKSSWLITDKQYAYVINSDYLFNKFRLHMTSRAFNKLILQIRLLLRDEKRVEEFYNHYEDKDLQNALKWLPHCSQPFIEKVLEKHAKDNEISNNLLKRLCERSMKFLDIYCRVNKQYYKRQALVETMFVMNDDVDRYLDIIESMSDCTPTFTAKYTKIIMTKCRNRIMEKLDRYADYIDVPTFAKFISEDEIKDFILKHIKNKNMRSWFRGQKVKYLISRLPSDIKFDFTKKIFIDKEHKNDDFNDDSTLGDAIPYGSVPMSCGKIGKISKTSKNIYTWYVFAPFKTAFTDLKRLVRAESNPNERIAILTVLLITAGHNMQNIHTLLKYYREHHINEPFKFKIQFINIVLSKTKAYKYDKDLWNCLKDIFFSMGAYNESDNNVKLCVRSILLYSVINDEPVPEVVDKKIGFETLKRYKKNLSQDEQNKLFNYLLKSICVKIKNEKLQSEKEFENMYSILENALILLCDWDKDLKDYPSILDKVKQLIEIKKENPTWDMDIRILYNKKKSWKKLLFTESLLVCPAQGTVMNALKHDIKLIETYILKIEELLKNNQNLDIFFKKIRIYCSQSLSIYFKKILIDSLHQNYNHKYFITGLCTLLPHKEILEIIKKYVPLEAKINWSQHDEVQLYIRKYLAMNLYSARPQPSLDIALLYAKGDYLQYVLPSLNAILYNMSTANVTENLKTLLNSPVSLQKHGIRAAILKLEHEDLKQILSDMWKSNKNSSIRADIFVHSHRMLCKEKNEELIKEKWELIKMFIDNLTPDENKKIYTTLSEVENVPMSIRGEHWIKSYEFFNSLPTKVNCGNLLDHLILNMTNIMHSLDDDYVAKIFMTLFDKNFCTKDYTYAQYVATFLLSAKTEDEQMKRYNKICVPMFEKSFPVWDKKHEGVFYVRNNINKVIKHLSVRFDLLVHEDIVFPIKMFTEILETLQKNLSETENYILINIQKLGLKYITIMDTILREDKEKDSDSSFKTMSKDDLVKIVHENVTLKFSKACIEYLKEDIGNNFSSIYIPFGQALNYVFSYYGNNQMNKLTALKAILDDKEFIAGYLLVLETLPNYLYHDKEKALKQEVLNKIEEHPNKEIKMHYSIFQNGKGTRYF